jgi:hypothetical protein
MLLLAVTLTAEVPERNPLRGKRGDTVDERYGNIPIPGSRVATPPR